MEYFVLKLITNYDQTGDPRILGCKWLFDIKEFPQDHLIKRKITLRWIKG